MKYTCSTRWSILFILGGVGYKELKASRQLALAVYMFHLIRGKIDNPELLGRISYVTSIYMIHHIYRGAPRERTNLVREALLTRATHLFNKLSDQVCHLFSCTLNEFTRTGYFCYMLWGLSDYYIKLFFVYYHIRQCSSNDSM